MIIKSQSKTRVIMRKKTLNLDMQFNKYFNLKMIQLELREHLNTYTTKQLKHNHKLSKLMLTIVNIKNKMELIML